MARHLITAALAIAAVVAGARSVASDDDHRRPGQFEARLNGFEENPSISTTGRGRLAVEIDDKAETITYTLRYSDLEGVLVPGGVVTAAHIHLGARRTNGGVVAFLCGGGGKPACPPPDGD